MRSASLPPDVAGCSRTEGSGSRVLLTSRTPSRSRAAVIASVGIAVGVAAAALAGCTPTATADPTPQPTAAASVTPTTTPTPTPTASPPPVRPTAMDTVDVNGAIAAVTYFMELYPYVYNTGDVSQMAELSHPECIFCRSVIDHADEMHALGQHQVGTATRLLAPVGVEVNAGYWFTVEADVEQAGWTVLDGAGNVIEEDLTTKTHTMFFAVIHESGRWFVRGAEITSD